MPLSALVLSGLPLTHIRGNCLELVYINCLASSGEVVAASKWFLRRVAMVATTSPAASCTAAALASGRSGHFVADSYARTHAMG